MSSKCPTCGKTVYFAERQSALGKDYHKLCFKCTQCKKALQPGSFSENEGKLYCKSCYSSVIGLKGYGFSNALDSHVAGGAAGVVPGPVSAAGGAGGFCSNCGAKASGKFCSGCGSAV